MSCLVTCEAACLVVAEDDPLKGMTVTLPGLSFTFRQAVKSNTAVAILILIYLLTAIGLSPGGSSTVHIYTQTKHRTTQNKQYIEQHNNLGKCGPCPVLASYPLAFALQLRKKHGKTSVRDRMEVGGSVSCPGRSAPPPGEIPHPR